MLKRIFLAVFILCLFTNFSFGQLSENGTPVSDRLNFATPIPTITLPSINIDLLKEEDKIDIENNNPLRFAFGHDVDFNLNNSGQWTTLKSGDRVWRLTIECPEALNINFLYNDFYLPKGANLFIYDKNKTQILGAFTEKNNKSNRKFATALIHDEFATLEYFEPARSFGQGRISIAQVGHGYRPLNAESNSSLGNSGDCQVNVNCEEGNDWQDQKKGVGKIVMDGLYLCSGNLINNTANDCKPYFLTANHCIMGGVMQDAIINPDVSGYIFYWNFERQGCENSGFVSDAQTTSGGTVVANSGIANTGLHTIISSDFALIELDESPRGQYDVYFNGWDASGEQGNTGVGIHHPSGDAKKISTHDITPNLDGYYWRFFWNSTPNGHSVTEGGSSGSSLFRETGLVIGQLFGGGSVNCDDPANDAALYGRLDYSWTNEDLPDSSDPRRRLNVWLDPIGQGSIRVLNGAYDPCNVRQVYFHEGRDTINEENGGTNTGGCLDYKDYTYTIGITPFPLGTITAEINASGDALEGENRDFTYFPKTVSFSGPFNQQTFTVRVYNDVYEETDETIEFSFTLTGSNVAPMPALSSMEITLRNGDVMPNTHIQSVTNNGLTEYLGAFGKVHYAGTGANGFMMTIENLSDHDFGCTSVNVDNAGANANNDYVSGSTFRKTFNVVPEFESIDAPIRVTVYYTNSEVQGYEFFNNEGSNRNNVSIIRFDDSAAIENENTAVSTATTLGNYGSGFTFVGDFVGLTESGFTVGNLSTNSANFQNFDNGIQNGNAEILDLKLSPNPASNDLKIQWNAENAALGQLHIVDVSGKILFTQTIETIEGYNENNIDVSIFQEGVYFLQIMNEEGLLETKRFVKTR